MMPLRKFLVILFFGLLFTGMNITYAQEPPISSRIPGLWLYFCWHGDASVADADGTPVTKPIFIPESYREPADQLSESFFHFRADGTGTYFKRYVVFKTNGETITVVTKDRHGQWVKGDRLESKSGFTWKIKGDQIRIRPDKDSAEFTKKSKYRFVLNTTPTRRAPRPITNRLQLSDELIIYQLGQFLKVGREAEQNLLQRYGLNQD